MNEAYQYGVLDPKVHSRIVADLQRYSERAGVPSEAICRGLSNYVDEREVTWVRNFLRNRTAPPPGLAYVGRWTDVNNRMIGIAGCMVRNFVDARVMTAHRVVEESPTATLLLIPNFYASGVKMPDWKVSQLTDILVGRRNAGKSTVLYVEDMTGLMAMYGNATADFVNRMKVFES